MDTSGTKFWLPGISDTATLDAASALCGTTAMKETRNWSVPAFLDTELGCQLTELPIS